MRPFECCGSVVALPAMLAACEPTVASHQDLAGNVGRKVTVTGTLASNPWQHPVAPPPGRRNVHYLNLRDDGQIVVYAGSEVECEDKAVRVHGKVIRIEVPAKGATAGETVKAYQVVADAWKCLETSP